MNKNDIITLHIDGVTSEGFGIGRHEGMVVFVPFTAIGDEAEVRIVKSVKSYCYGRVERLLMPSPDRCEPGCTVFGRCGGCTFRHISYEAEVRVKEEIIRSAFERIGGLEPEFLPLISTENTERYRNKAQYPVGRDKDGHIISGFFAPRSHRIIPSDECALEPPLFREIRTFITDSCAELKISPYNEEQHNGIIRHICLRRGHHTGEISAVLVVRKSVPELKRLARTLTDRFPDIVSVYANINPDRTNVIYGSEDILLRGKPVITDTMLGKSFEISPKSFYQVNTPMAERLYSEAAKLAQPAGKTLIDLYCGIGTVGLSMYDGTERLIGVEIVPDAVKNARRNAELNNAEKAEFYEGDAGKVTTLLREKGITADVVTVDPARKGCDNRTLENILAFSPERIVMISCDPATAARDCGFLSQHGYRAVSVRGVDLFPRTVHVETVVFMSREGQRV